MWCSMPTKTGTIPSSFLFAQGEGEDNVGLDSNVMATRTAETKKGTVKNKPSNFLPHCATANLSLFRVLGHGTFLQV